MRAGYGVLMGDRLVFVDGVGPVVPSGILPIEVVVEVAQRPKGRIDHWILPDCHIPGFGLFSIEEISEILGHIFNAIVFQLCGLDEVCELRGADISG